MIPDDDHIPEMTNAYSFNMGEMLAYSTGVRDAAAFVDRVAEEVRRCASDSQRDDAELIAKCMVSLAEALRLEVM